MNLLEFYASLRAELIAVITGVEDARASPFSWDDTVPNYVTKRKLGDILKKYTESAAVFGFHVIVRHSDCSNPKHARSGVSGYVMDSINGEKVKYRDSRFHWGGGQMYQGEKRCSCPCAPENRLTTHHVIEDIVYALNADHKACKNIEDILNDVDIAIANAGDGQRRSGIREYLLRAVLRINDAILPMPMDDYITHQLSLSGRRNVSAITA